MEMSKRSKQRMVSLFLIAIALIMVSLACNYGEPRPLYTPEKPTEYTAIVQPDSDVYVLIDEAGNVVDFGGPYAYGVNARMRYVLKFWDVGNRLDGYGGATIYRVYMPINVTGINQEIEEKLSEGQKADIYARTSFPTTEVKLHDLNFSGGPEGTFHGINSETGKDIFGHMDWREKEWEMHVVFTEDFKQDYLGIADEPFYNWL
jgi:hypothetical protein